MTNCFECVDPQNYADVALILQDTAMRAEECIYSLESRLRQAVNPATMIVDFPTVNVAANVRAPIAANFISPIFQNAQLEKISTFDTLAPGFYSVGISLTATATGAVTDNSIRQIDIAVRPTLSGPSTPDDYTARYIVMEANVGGGMDMTANTTITVAGEQRIAFFFIHTNASTIDLTNGTIWISRISDAFVTRVVE